MLNWAPAAAGAAAALGYGQVGWLVMRWQGTAVVGGRGVVGTRRPLKACLTCVVVYRRAQLTLSELVGQHHTCNVMFFNKALLLLLLLLFPAALLRPLLPTVAAARA